MSAIIGTAGLASQSATVSVGDGGTVYLTFDDEAHGADWFFSPSHALKLAELLEKAARYYEPDHRTRAEQAQDKVDRLLAALRDLAEQQEQLRQAALDVVKGAYASERLMHAVEVPTNRIAHLEDLLAEPQDEHESGGDVQPVVEAEQDRRPVG
jgi:predicted  nucleic acid-binding Zn-ribbon protein